MAKKGQIQKKKILDIISEAKKNVSASQTVGQASYIPNIIEFVESNKYLGISLKSKGIELYPVQRIMLKVFYRGSIGNENIKLTKGEIELCKDLLLDGEHNGDILGKYESGYTFRELVLVWGRRCLSENSTIIDPSTGREWTLGELWDYGKTDGIMSWTYDERIKEMRIIPNCNLVYQGKRKVYKIKTQSGHEIEATDNHPFLTQRGWVKLKDLKTNEDKVALVESEPFFGNSDAISEDEAAILGYITADGCCSQSSVFFTCAKQKILEDFKYRLNRISDNLEIFKDPWTGAKSKEYQYKIRAKQIKNENYYCESSCRTRPKRAKNDLQKLLVKHGLFGKTCHYKSAPKSLFECPKNVIATYLKALYSCDGCINLSRGKNQVSIEFTTVNKDQSIAISKLLRRFGILSRIRTRKQKTHIKKENRSYNNTSYEISFTKKKYIELFFKYIGLFDQEDKIRKSKERIKNVIGKNANKCCIFSRIIDINYAKNSRTFDIQVSDKEYLQNFSCNGFVCHNSGKDFFASIIALYEVCKLLECPDGDPFKYYGVGSDAPITILTIANSQDQAATAYQEISGKFFRSDYFEGRYLKEGAAKEGEIHVLTKRDIKENVERKAKGFKPRLGSILIRTGHSQATTLAGKGCFVVIFDEIGLYKTTSGPSSGEELYTTITPTVNTYVRTEKLFEPNGVPLLGEDGEQLTKTVYDGKLISISSPRGEEGIFYKLYKNANEIPHRLMCRLATWDVNINHTQQGLREIEADWSDEKFDMEYAAEFSGSAGSNFFSKDIIDTCFRKKDLKFTEGGVPGFIYYAHLDPATSSHNYALCIAHREVFYDEERHKMDYCVVIDHLKFWTPQANKPINVDDIDNYVISMSRRYRFALVTYDAWNSERSIQNLHKHAVRSKMLPFNGINKIRIYDNFDMLAASGRLLIPYHHRLFSEMTNLQRTYRERRYRVGPKVGSDIDTDDLVDAVAGCVYNCINTKESKLPQGKIIDIPVQGNKMVWKSMQGVPLGYGSGPQVARDLENRSHAYKYRNSGNSPFFGT